jgi:hypothetical protein
MSARNIQRSAVATQTASAVFSPRDMRPGFSIPSCSSGMAAPFGTPAVLTTTAQQTGTRTIR